MNRWTVGVEFTIKEEPDGKWMIVDQRTEEGRTLNEGDQVDISPNEVAVFNKRGEIVWMKEMAG